MGLGVIAVTGLSSFSISIIKDLIPRKVRMITQVLVIAFYTVIVDIVLKAYVPEVSKELGPYVGLIITKLYYYGTSRSVCSIKFALSVIMGWDNEWDWIYGSAFCSINF